MMQLQRETVGFGRVLPLKAVGFVMAVLALCTGAHAGVIVTAENQDNTAWPHADPVINTAGSDLPSAFGSTVAVGGTTGNTASQTILVAQTFQLARIDLTYRTTASSGTVGIRIQEASPALNGGATAYEYSSGPDLFAAPLSFTYGVQTAASTTKVMTLDFTGSDQITLVAGKTYAIEFVNVTGSSTGFALTRRGASTYPDGMVFSNRVSVNGTGTRDAAMQIFAVPEPASLVLAFAGSALICARRRRG